MGAVHVGIGHQNNAVIAQLVGVVIVLADAGTQGSDQRGDFLRRHQFVEAGFFNVQNLALERQDGLELAVAPLLG